MLSNVKINPIVSVIGSLICAAAFAYIAHTMSHHPVVQSILENLAADAILIGITLTFLDSWTKRRDHLVYDKTEAMALGDCQQTVYLCISMVGLDMQDAVKTGGKDFVAVTPRSESIQNIEDLWYLEGRSVLERLDYNKVTEKEAKFVLANIQRAVDEISKTITWYERSFSPKSYRGVLKLRRRLDVSASPGLALLSITIQSFEDISDKIIDSGQGKKLKTGRPTKHIAHLYLL